MIRIYKDRALIPSAEEFIEWNDFYFNRVTADLLDERAAVYIRRIDKSEPLSKYSIRSQFNQDSVNVDCLSTGCKTVLNIIYHPDKVFSIKECGDNALDEIYGLEEGKVYSEYPMISFDVKSVEVVDRQGIRVIEGYDELKDWWENEE